MKSWVTGKVSDAEKEWGQEEKRVTGWDGWMASLTQWTWVWTKRVKDREAWHAAVPGISKCHTR